MAKARVHELAKEFGVTSKEVLAALTEMGEYVKSPSSTVEPPVVRRLTEERGDAWKAAAEAKAAKKAAKKAPAKKAAKTAEAAEAAPAAEVAEAPAEASAAKPGPKPARPTRGVRTGRGRHPGRGTGAVGRGSKRPLLRRMTPRKLPAEKPDSELTAAELAARQPKPSGQPRPGNNPFSSTQGMQHSRRPDPGQMPPRPPAARDGRSGAPRPGGVPGAPRPNPAMMPKQSAGQLGGPGGARGPRGGGPGGPGRTGAPVAAEPVLVQVQALRPVVVAAAMPASRSPRWRSWWPAARWRRTSRWRRSQCPRHDPGCLRSPRWSVASWSQVQARASSRVRADAGTGRRRCARTQG